MAKKLWVLCVLALLLPASPASPAAADVFGACSSLNNPGTTLSRVGLWAALRSKDGAPEFVAIGERERRLDREVSEVAKFRQRPASFRIPGPREDVALEIVERKPGLLLSSRMIRNIPGVSVTGITFLDGRQVYLQLHDGDGGKAEIAGMAQLIRKAFAAMPRSIRPQFTEQPGMFELRGSFRKTQ